MKPKTSHKTSHKTPSRIRARKPAWIGVRVTVCGYRIPVKGNDIICQLIPGHEPHDTHAATAINEYNKPVLVIYYQTHSNEEIVCLEDV